MVRRMAWSHWGASGLMNIALPSAFGYLFDDPTWQP